MTEVSDEALAHRFARTKDREAFETLVLRHLGSLRRFLAVSLPGDPEAQADAEQEVLFKLFDSLPRWRQKSTFTTYLFVLARRAAVDEVRRRVRERRRSDRWGLWTKAERESRQAQQDPLILYSERETQTTLREALNDLPEPDRSLLYLKDAEDQSIEALARIFGLKEGTIKSKLSRARNRLRGWLEEQVHA